MVAIGFEDQRVCIIGLGYVGLTLAVAMADVGFKVVGIERNPAILRELAQGRAHFKEVGMESRLVRAIESGRLTVLSDIPPRDKCTVYIITVGTPIDNDTKVTRMEAIKGVAGQVATALKANDLVVLRSTVRVGVSREVVMPVLDRANVPYQIAFCPERTVEGKAIEELRTLPQIVGGFDNVSTLRASRLFHMLTPSVVRVSGLEEAEMVKLVNNTHRDIMFAFANEVGAAAEAAGLSSMEVIRAANLGYPRGGVPMPGPVGGPCLEKDPYILAEGLTRHGFTPELSLAGRRLNELVPMRAAASAKRFLEARGRSCNRIAVVGLAFKGRPSTSDLRGTLAGPLINELKAIFPFATFVGWDPVADSQEILDQLHLEVAAELEDAAMGADLVIIQNNHAAFKDMDFSAISTCMSPNGLIYDMWGQNDGEELSLRNGVAYGSFGSAKLAGDQDVLKAPKPSEPLLVDDTRAA